MGRSRSIQQGATVRALLFLVLLLAPILSCSPPGGQGQGIGVVVTIPPLAEFVERVGAGQVSVTVMVPPGASPHTYEPTPSQMVAVSQADMYVKVGTPVEFELAWMGNIIEANPAMLVVDSSQGIELIGGEGAEGHEGVDPHIWGSPQNARVMVENICAGLIAIDPGNAALYADNRDHYLKELAILDGYFHCRLDGFTNRVFMTYHPAFGYLAEEYGLTQLAVEHEGKEPTPQVLQDSIDKAEQYHLHYVFVAPQFASDDSETIASAIGGETAPMDPLPRHYIATMGDIADLLALELE